MNTAIYSPSGTSAGIGFAIPSDTVKFIVETLIRDGEGMSIGECMRHVPIILNVAHLHFPLWLFFVNSVVRPVLGISYLESKQARALGIQNGVLVLDVPENSPAYKAGLRGTHRTESGLIELGDILAKVGDTVISTESDLFRALENNKPGDKITLTINRVTVTAENQVTLATIELPEVVLQSSVDVERQMKLYQVPSRVVPPVPSQ